MVHTLWGGTVNRPFAMALDAAWEERHGERLEAYVADDCIILMTPHEIDAAELVPLMTSAHVEALLRKRLEGSGFFGARFRERAGRAMQITRNKAGQRMPLWLSRLRSQKLLDAVVAPAVPELLVQGTPRSGSQSRQIVERRGPRDLRGGGRARAARRPAERRASLSERSHEIVERGAGPRVTS